MAPIYMLKELSKQGIIELGIEEKFAGKLWAYVAVRPTLRNDIGLGIATANEPGYSPIPMFYSFASGPGALTFMNQHAEALNAARGIDKEAAGRIVASSLVAQDHKKRTKAMDELRGVPEKVLDLLVDMRHQLTTDADLEDCVAADKYSRFAARIGLVLVANNRAPIGEFVADDLLEAS